MKRKLCEKCGGAGELEIETPTQYLYNTCHVCSGEGEIDEELETQRAEWYHEHAPKGTDLL
jgi:DnaJ-class molecular chaperone